MSKSRPEPRTTAALLSALLAVLALVVPIAAPATAQEGGGPAEVGAFSPLFEEGGAEQPRCVTEEDGSLLCKPTAVSVSVLDDGSIMYFNGIENTEGNVELTVLTEAGLVLEDSQARSLRFPADRAAAPLFGSLSRGVNGDNPAGYVDPAEDPLAVLGVPGRPGDGLVGSTVGQVVPTNPVAPPDDRVANDTDMFCSDLAHLPDGRILIAGGSDFYATAGGIPEEGIPGVSAGLGGQGVGEIEGIRLAQVYDPATSTFEQVGDMKYGRWYPTLTTLPGGDTFVAGGVTRLVFDSQLSNVRRTETLDRDTLQWSENYADLSSENSLPLYARMHLTPDGKVFYAANGQMNGFGPTGYAGDEATWGLYQSFDPETTAWEIHGPTPYLGLPRNGAFSVPLMLEGDYSTMEILQGGGTLAPTPGSAVATTLSQIISVDRDSTVQTRETGPMASPRWFTTGTLLPDGTVFASGGGRIDHVIASGFETAVTQTEIFDPETETWTPMATQGRERVYHNSAALLPDGRVLVGGHSPIPLGVIMSHQDLGAPFTNNNKDSSFEIFSPPYLFNADGTPAARPVITAAPATIAHGDSFAVGLQGGAAEISSVSLIRQADISHAVDADARGLSLPFTMNGNGSLSVQAPATGVDAPPGPYMLFVNRMTADGTEVPSVAAMVRVDGGDRVSTGGSALVPDYDSAANAANGSATPTEDSNILEGILTRNYPAPGTEEVVDRIVADIGPAELALLGTLSDQASANFAEMATPEQVLDELAAMAGRPDFSQEVYDMWPSDLLAMIFVDGGSEAARGFSTLLSTLAGMGFVGPGLPGADGLPSPEGLPPVPGAPALPPPPPGGGGGLPPVPGLPPIDPVGLLGG